MCVTAVCCANAAATNEGNHKWKFMDGILTVSENFSKLLHDSVEADDEQ